MLKAIDSSKNGIAKIIDKEKPSENVDNCQDIIIRCPFKNTDDYGNSYRRIDG